MLSLLLIWLVNALALLIVSSLIPGFRIEGLFSALVVALVLGFVNAIIRPLVLLLTLPITIVTLGLFIFVINALMLLLVSSIVKGFTIEGFAPAFWAAIALWGISFLSNWLASRQK